MAIDITQQYNNLVSQGKKVGGNPPAYPAVGTTYDVDSVRLDDLGREIDDINRGTAIVVWTDPRKNSRYGNTSTVLPSGTEPIITPAPTATTSPVSQQAGYDWDSFPVSTISAEEVQVTGKGKQQSKADSSQANTSQAQGTAADMKARAQNWYGKSKQYLEDRLGVLKDNWQEDVEGKEWTPILNQIPEINVRETLSPVDPYLAHASHWYAQHPKTRILGSVGGGLVANAMLGNPVGGVIDAVTGNVLDLRRDNETAMDRYVPNNAIKPLSAEDVQKQRDYLNRKIAVDTLTLNELRRMGAINETSNPNASYNPEFYQP